MSDVTIGVNFHWERKETQTFLGALRFVVESDKIYAINELPVERYLESVISSEMSATSSLELAEGACRDFAFVAFGSDAAAQRGGGEWQQFLLFHRRRRIRSSVGTTVRVSTPLSMFVPMTTVSVTRASRRKPHHMWPRRSELHPRPGVCWMVTRFVMPDSRSVVGGLTEEFQYCWENTPKSISRP